ncbi:hypothetical protein P1J78_13870 [Psychromarinibacter sp. C21-152]|uniref:Uncharacterized protein n=1 Tax=Psychromarinibacter sediminicola TaxID=3033385 RepID=A0AAE3NUD1_9RHOB|nr:hypothetical protein [Psychromarinibacter sediminicola]MDF0601829.1 hypothetical protein [Psychromarinibacter sediminicola]
MDPVTLTYYALVCGLLSAFAPTVRRRIARLAVGAVIGLVAAGALPFVRATLPFY